MPYSSRLTEDEFNAVYYWIDDHKDELDETLKRGLLKLISAEQQRIIQTTREGKQC
jgi:hypothetical protein